MSTHPDDDQQQNGHPLGVSRRNLLLAGSALAAAALTTSGGATPAVAQQSAQPAAAGAKPNILMIMGDDIGWFNPSIYNRGMMGYRTPNIDRIGNEGADLHRLVRRSRAAPPAAPPSSPASRRSAPASPRSACPAPMSACSRRTRRSPNSLRRKDIRPASSARTTWATSDELLPTDHGFDEFFGNLYHLNAEEEPENPDYPKEPRVPQTLRPARRHPLLCRWPDRRHRSPDEETHGNGRRASFWSAALDFIDRQNNAQKPWFCYFNSTRMHVNTHLKPESAGKTGKGVYADGMVEHDGMVGELLKKLDDLGLVENTIVIYTTDNGAEVMTWPDGGSTPFRGEKATNWEGGYRVPTCIRWPGVIKPNTVYNDMFSHYDFIPTFCAAAGEPDIVAKCKAGYEAGTKTFKVHLDGNNLMPFFRGEVKDGPRRDSSIGTTTANWSPCASRTGRSCSRHRKAPASASGATSSPRSACPSCST